MRRGGNVVAMKMIVRDDEDASIGSRARTENRESGLRSPIHSAFSRTFSSAICRINEVYQDAFPFYSLNGSSDFHKKIVDIVHHFYSLSLPRTSHIIDAVHNAIE